jgi:SAM-dependent methyltransferase
VLEIGGGDGELGAAFWSAAAAAGRPTGRALRLDASPALLALQATLQPHTVGTLGDATQLPYPDGSVDLVLCNEVMADLMAAPWGPGASGGPAQAVAERVAQYGLSPLPPGALHNLGAWQLVEEVGRVLAPGGAAFLSEFGALDEVPTETTQLDHPEVSIHFGHLQQVAAGCGLAAEVVSLADLLGADLAARWLSRPSWDAARALSAAAGVHLPARAWTAATLTLPERVERLADAPVSSDGPGPVLTRFLALLLRRPPLK